MKIVDDIFPGFRDSISYDEFNAFAKKLVAKCAEVASGYAGDEQLTEDERTTARAIADEISELGEASR